MNELLPYLGATLLAIGVATQGYHILRKSNERSSLPKGLMVGGALEMLGFFILVGAGLTTSLLHFVAGGFVGGIVLAGLWSVAFRPGEPRP